uniref:Putative secreted protein n=1 Tax=Panstrongylus lignarius TaxID=156445 RepID=A0A224Y255_9HEMI
MTAVMVSLKIFLREAIIFSLTWVVSSSACTWLDSSSPPDSSPGGAADGSIGTFFCLNFCKTSALIVRNSSTDKILFGGLLRTNSSKFSKCVL